MKPLNSEKEQDRLISLKTNEKRFSFLFEDAWFVLLQYMFFEKFIAINSNYYQFYYQLSETLLEFTISLMKEFGFMFFNLIFTAFIGLIGLLDSINFCFKMIKQGKTKTKIYFISTFIQILLQTTFPFIRAGIVIFACFTPIADMPSVKMCTLVGFKVNPFRIKLLSLTVALFFVIFYQRGQFRPYLDL